LVKNDTAFKRAAQIIREISSQRLRMRNEQFGFPLTENDIEGLHLRAKEAWAHR
jgi:hypothetical protein